MTFKPNEITKEHVLKVVKIIEEQGIELIAPTKYYVQINGKNYPPKEIMRFAHEQLTGEKLWEYSGGDPTNKFLEKMGFKIINKDDDIDPIAVLIEKYKTHIKETKLKDELYKWELLKKFKGKPSLETNNLYNEVVDIDFKNLLFFNAFRVIKHLSKDRPEDYKNCLTLLFDETINLQVRISQFETEITKVYRQVEDKYYHQQDERTIATLLTFKYPEKYTFFKDSFYQKYCKYLGIKAKNKGEKYIHYLELINDLISEYIEKDNVLIELVNGFIGFPQYYDDLNHKILAQDILYQVLEQMPKIGGVIGLMASDSTGWQDRFVEEMVSYNACIVWNSKRPSGTDKTIHFLRDITNDGNSFNLYYCTKSIVTHRARVIDFIENQKELDESEWDKNYNILHFEKEFNNYVDGNKTAKIVFLIDNFEKTEPIPVSEFEFYGTFEEPRQDNLSPISKEPNLIDQNQNNRESKKHMKIPLNHILYGPPGTGKTYNTINHALAIIENKSIESINALKREDIKKKFSKYLSQGQIVFTTFHQSMSYEDFIEGIKPETIDNNVQYHIEDGIFKKICQAAQTPNQIDFNVAYENLKKDLSEIEMLSLKTPTGKEFSISLNSNDNLTLHTGPKKEKQGTLTKENIQKQINGEDKFIGWEGYFKSIVECIETQYGYSSKAKNKSQNFVLIIDEINRGNVSQIFGELITLIEEDKRLGKEEELEVILPYSKKLFGVPQNLYIIGTLNTADRSVEALDTALRRRFSFEEISPKPDLLKPSLMLIQLWNKYAGYEWEHPDWIKAENDFLKLHDAKIRNREKYEKLENNSSKEDIVIKFEEIIDFNGLRLDYLLSTINKRIEKLLDKDHQIGHSYFMTVYSWDELELVFYKNIIPLLQEYFFGDFGKIGLVLGNGFVSKKEWDKNSDSFAEFEHESSAEFDVRDIYNIVDYRTENNYSIKIKENKITMTFEKAIKLLMKKHIE